MTSARGIALNKNTLFGASCSACLYVFILGLQLSFFKLTYIKVHICIYRKNTAAASVQKVFALKSVKPDAIILYFSRFVKKMLAVNWGLRLMIFFRNIENYKVFYPKQFDILASFSLILSLSLFSFRFTKWITTTISFNTFTNSDTITVNSIG